MRQFIKGLTLYTKENIPFMILLIVGEVNLFLCVNILPFASVCTVVQKVGLNFQTTQKFPCGSKMEDVGTELLERPPDHCTVGHCLIF